MNTNVSLGAPSAPTLITSPAPDLESLNFTITAPEYAPECVVAYTISTAADNMEIVNFNVTASPNGSETSLLMGRYNLCVSTYNFTALPITRDGPGQMSSVYTQSPVCLSGIFKSLGGSSMILFLI